MKKISTILSAILLVASVIAQSPQKMSYQAVVRDANGKLVTSHAVGIKVSILQGSVSGSSVYSETQTTTTNANGLISIEIGGTALNVVNWANGPYFMKTETDPAGGSNYTITATSQLLSVPYALYAKTAENGFSGNYNDLINKPAIPSIPPTLSVPANIVPRTAMRGQQLSVSFSGGDDLSFTQSSSSCPNLYADVQLSFTPSSSTIVFIQGSPVIFYAGSPTIIAPVDKYFIDSKRFDAIFDIPSYIPSGLYNIILSPSSSCPFTFSSAFKIY